MGEAFIPYRDQHCEADVIGGLSLELAQRGYKVRRSRKLRFGIIDLIAWNDRQVVVFEIKHEGAFNDILHGLGQLLVYRRQFQDAKGRPVKYVLYATGELEWELFNFLKETCAQHDVILHARLVEQAKYL